MHNNAVTSALSRCRQFVNQHHLWCVFLYLLFLEVVVFAPLLSKIGFYLDDWGMLSALTFAPDAAAAKVGHFLLKDAKTIIRPVEAIHFGGLFLLAGTKPLLWHVFNGLLEVLAGWLLYVCIDLFVENRLLALIASALFVLCPTHDCTHYWVLASSASLSMDCWLGSLACTILAVRKQRIALHFASFVLFGISLFNYELFVPLAAINVLSVWWFSVKPPVESGSDHLAVPGGTVLPGRIQWTSVRALQSACFAAMGFSAAIASYLLWVRVIVPRIGIGYIHPIQFSLATMVNTVVRGTAVSLPFEQIPFYAEYTRNAFDPTAAAPMIAIVLVTVMLSLALASQLPGRSQVAALLLGTAVLIPVSYTVFGLSPEYTPTLMTIINRVNYGASVGTCLLYALAIVALGQLCAPRKADTARAVVASAAGIVLALFALTDRAMAKPWELSWTMQKHVASLVKTHPAEVTAASCVMLMNSPRYVMWAPVFDGTWDFENLARVTLKNKDLKFGVVSERLKIDSDQATDVSSEFVCGTYPFRGMLAIVAPQSLFVSINSAPEFIKCVQENGFGFGLDTSMPVKWQKQLIAGSGSRIAKPY